MRPEAVHAQYHARPIQYARRALCTAAEWEAAPAAGRARDLRGETKPRSGVARDVREAPYRRSARDAPPARLWQARSCNRPFHVPDRRAAVRAGAFLLPAV